MENKKFNLNFNKDVPNEFDNGEPRYLAYDENNDTIIKTDKVKKDYLGEDSFSLEDFIKESQKNENKNPYTDVNTQNIEHKNKAKPILIVGFVFMLLIVVIVALIIILMKPTSTKENINKNNNEVTTNKTNTDDEITKEDNVVINTDTENMYGEGYYKIYNKNVKFYSAIDTMAILQNANNSIKQYFSDIKKIESDNLNTVKRKQSIEKLEDIISKDFKTLETSKKVFNKYDAEGINLYDCIYSRFENVEGLLNEIKFMSSGKNSIDKINNSIDKDNTKIKEMSELVKTFANKNELQYKENDNLLKIDN